MTTLTPKPIPVFDGSCLDAHTLAIDQSAPVFVPVSVYTDDRGWSIMNQLQGVMSPEGQINYSVQYPGVVKAWHRHKKQTDFWLCLSGHIKVGVHRDGGETGGEAGGETWMAVIGEKCTGIVVVPPTLWHGAATVGHTPAGLLYYVTHAYDPANPDEERRAFDSVDGFPWRAQHR